MCGIAGIWRFDQKKVTSPEIEVFTDSMKHRGPDGGGYKVFENVNLALGHRRLSIVDLSSNASQPMCDGEQDLWITFNGEIYNFIEIRKELKDLGCNFKTNSDTEVILAAYKKWGADCLHKFNGMFAFAIYEPKEQELFIARDRFGVKPFHYAYIPGSLFAFASETIAFNHLQNFDRKINSSSFIFSINKPGTLDSTDRTIFENIYQLKAGNYARIKVNDIKVTQWYELSRYITPVNEPYGEQVEKFKELFFDACKLRLRSDVSIASALSGGVDSSSVFCAIHQLGSKQYNGERLPDNWQQAFSVSFPGTQQDESEYVRLIKNRLNADVKIIEHDHGNLVADIISSTVLLDNIIGTPLVSASEVYKAMRANGVIVSLDGHAGDELLFGYRSAIYELLFEAHLHGGFDSNELAELYLHMGESPCTVNDIKNLNSKLEGIVKRFKPGFKNSIKNILSGFKRNSNTEEFPIPSIIRGHANRHLYKQFQYSELPYNLRDFDRASMQHSVEIRMPLMDYRVVEYCWSLPVSSKVGKGYTKRILRDAMKGLVPNEILERKSKVGLRAPMGDWFNGSLSEFMLDTVNSKAFIESPYWNGEKLSKEYSEITQKKEWTQETASKAWCVLNAHIVSSSGNQTKSFNSHVSVSALGYQQCKTCLMDNKITKEISFDESGTCSYCKGFEKMRSYTFGRPTQVLESELNEYVKEMKQHGKGNPYDCIIGLSGGVDSTYVAYLVKKLGLRVLAVHFDNGWDSELAVKNIENIIKKTGFDLETYVVNWNEFKDLQRAYLKASVIDIEVLSDHMIVATLYRLCKQYKIKYIISGNNLATEYVIGKDWVYNKNDLTNILSIHKKFGTVPLKTFPKLGFTKLFFQKWIYGYKSIDILNYVDYKKNDVKKLIADEFEWKDYGGKHYESIWTKFYQGYILPKKFGVDKRIAHLSNLIMTKEITKEAAIEQLKAQPLGQSEERELEEYVLKKLEFTKSEWDQIMKSKAIPHQFYETEDSVIFIRIVKGIRKLKWKIIVDYLVPLKRTLTGKKAHA